MIKKVPSKLIGHNISFIIPFFFFNHFISLPSKSRLLIKHFFLFPANIRYVNFFSIISLKLN